MGNPRRWFGVLLSVALTSFVMTSAEATGPDLEQALAGIESGLAQSPNKYVAALVDRVAAPQCDSTCAASICTVDVTLLRVFAEKGGLNPGTTIRILGTGGDGGRMLGFFIPSAEGSPVFRATFATSVTGQKEVDAIVEALGSAGLEATPSARQPFRARTP